MTETWRAVVGYEQLYEVSDRGLVRSLDRIVDPSHPRLARGQLLKPSRKPNLGYLAVPLCKDGQQRTWNVHRLVAEAFIGPRPAGMDTCHNDGDKLNNCASNLRYDTRGGNLLDSVEHGTHPWASATACRRGHLYTPETTRTCVKSDGISVYRRCRICERMLRARRKADAIETRQLRAA